MNEQQKKKIICWISSEEVNNKLFSTCSLLIFVVRTSRIYVSGMNFIFFCFCRSRQHSEKKVRSNFFPHEFGIYRVDFEADDDLRTWKIVEYGNRQIDLNDFS